MRKNLLLTLALAGLVTALKCPAQEITFTADYVTNSPNYQEDFILRSNGVYVYNHDPARFWRNRDWSKATNGWWVGVYVETNYPWLVDVSGGSPVTNLGVGYLPTPYHKFAKLELLSPEGKAMQPRTNASANLRKWYTGGIRDLTNAPVWASSTNSSLVVKFPETVLAKDYPQYGLGLHDPVGGLGGFWTNDEPTSITLFELGKVYSITNEGNYTLTVQPVLYRLQSYTRTNGATDWLKTNDSEILRRVDLPSVTTKVHLVPNEVANSTRQP